ncbi:hypothetical protein O181_016831 [Austropuccinia psidii MF-1]|uniref:Uncharacterized protein n=1 Tax=Austropuccinia psidii MF-1 TaxID=1389203 RepID=A0A9Q3GRF6_9BASI|nr:hypothetical protein [Austropuccinia psidii MF-1]
MRGKRKKGSNQEKKPPATGFNPLNPPQYSSSKKPHHKERKMGENSQASKDKPHASLLNKDNKLIGFEKERRIKEGLCTYFCGNQAIAKCFKRPKNRSGSSRGFPSKKGKASVEMIMCSIVLTYFLQEQNCAL